VIQKGIPFDVAHSLSLNDLLSYWIVFQGMDRPLDGQFNFDRFEFEEPKQR
jgi:hypothetical protein